MDLEQLYTWACNSLIMEYRHAPRNRALMRELVNLIFANNVLVDIKEGFDVETAVGKQLDIIGDWVGINRYYDAIDLWEQPYFALVNYSNVQDNEYEQWQGGFYNYTNFEENEGGFLTYKVWQDTRTKVNQMGDAYFRELIKLKIIKNSINSTKKNIDDAIYKWSNGTIYTTWDKMKVIYHYPKEKENLFILATYKNCLLAPTCCTIQLEKING